MSVTPACIAAVVDASQGAMRDDQAAELIRYMETLRRAEEAKGNLDQLDARLRQRAREQADSARIAAALAQKHAALAAVKHAEALTHIDMLVKAGLPRDTAYLAFFEGTTRNVAGGRASVAATSLAYTARHMERINRFLVDTPEAGRLVQRADKPFAEAVVREMEKPGSTGDSLAAATARAYSETAELVRQDLVRLGAPIGKLDGWRPQTHNAERVVRVSADEWADFILPRLDLDRSLPGLAPTLVRETLRDIHRSIITGVDRVPSAVEAGEKLGPANLANSLAQARVLHFKDSDAWLSYADRFGTGNIHEAMLGHIRHASRAAALMERLGPNPGAADTRIREALRRQAAEDSSLPPRERARLSKALDASNTFGRVASAWGEASGLTSAPASFGAAQLGTQIRAVQSWAKLAGAVVSSVGDLATRASALHYQGQPLAAAWRDSIGELFNRSRDRRQLAAMVDAGLDGMHGHLAAAGVAEDMPAGKIARVNAAFYRWQGMTWWSDMAKAGTARMLMRWMGQQSTDGFAALPVEYRRVLRQHGIGPDQWELIRATAFQAEDGQTYVAPDRIGALPLPRFARMAAPALQAMEKGLAERAAARATADAREAGWVRSRVAKFEAGMERARRHWQDVSKTAEGSRNARVQELRTRMDELDLRLSEVAEFHDALADGRAWTAAQDVPAPGAPRQPDPGGAAPGPDQPGAISVSGGFRPRREGYLAEGDPATLAARQEGELRARLDRLRRTIGQINRAAKGADVERLEAFDAFWRGKAAELDAFVRQVEDRAKARAAATLADKFEWEPRVQTALEDARRQLEMSVRRFFADEMRFGFIEPDAASRRISFQGTRPGTVTGEAMRFLMQFKGYPIAFTQRVLGRAVQGAGGEAIPGGGPADRMWGAQARHIGGLLAGLIVTGYLAMTVKDFIRGYGPRDPAEPKTILAALMQSGGAGIYGDFLFAQANRFGTGALGTVAGPTAGTAGSILDLWPKLRDGDAKAGEALNLALQNTPFINMWYAKPVLDFLILNALREGLSPGFLARQERDRREKFGQERWMPTTAWR